MKGLLRSHFYGALSNVRLFLGMYGILYAILLISGNDTLMSILSVMTGPALSQLAISVLRKESSSKWAMYKLTMPVTRAAIIRSLFFSHLIWAGVGLGGASVFMGLTVLIHGNRYFAYGLRDAMTLVLCGGVVSILLGAFSYPLLCLWGTERADAIQILSALASVATVFALTMGINFLLGPGTVTNAQYYLSVAVILAIAGILFGLSYAVTVAIFKRKAQ